jgi:uncharacterized protein YdhG (YjbR/CyaY superfamily)
MSHEPKAFDVYLAALPPEKEATTRKLIEIMRTQLAGTEEVMKRGIAVFRKNGKDLTGIAARRDFYSLYLPDEKLHSEFLPRLGKVSGGKGCIRFKKLENLNVWELGQLLEAVWEKAAE